MSRLVFRHRSHYPDGEVERLVRFAMADLELPSRRSILIRVGRCRTWGASGKAYPYVFAGPDVPAGASFEIHLRLAAPDRFPIFWPVEHGIEFGRVDWRETLVVLAAHEGKHIEVVQHTNSRTRREKLTGYQEEARCDAYALRRLEVYREGKAATGVEPAVFGL